MIHNDPVNYRVRTYEDRTTKNTTKGTNGPYPTVELVSGAVTTRTDLLAHDKSSEAARGCVCVVYRKGRLDDAS